MKKSRFIQPSIEQSSMCPLLNFVVSDPMKEKSPGKFSIFWRQNRIFAPKSHFRPSNRDSLVFAMPHDLRCLLLVDFIEKRPRHYAGDHQSDTTEAAATPESTATTLEPNGGRPAKRPLNTQALNTVYEISAILRFLWPSVIV